MMRSSRARPCPRGQFATGLERAESAAGSHAATVEPRGGLAVGWTGYSSRPRRIASATAAARSETPSLS